MASYDAQINILVAGQRNINNLLGQLNQVEDAIGQIESRWRTASAALQRADIRLGAIGRQQPRGEGGRFTSDPDRQARLNALADRRRAAVQQRLARMGLSMASAQEASIRDQIEGNERILRQTERRITFQERLNSAVQLFETRRQKLARGGGGRGLSQELQEQAREIQAAFQVAGGGASRNLALINSLATGLGRVVERQNEFNRAQALGSKGFEAGRRLQERIDVVAQRGVVPSRQIDRLRSGAARVIAASQSGDQQAYSEAVRAATAAISRVERESRKLAGDLARNATRSPIRGGIGFPGSPKAVEAQQRAQELALRQSQKGYPASPILGTATMAGSPRAAQAQERSRAAAERALRAQERVAKAAETAADRALKQAQQGYPTSPVLGSATTPGSPKALQAQQRAQAAADRALRAQARAAKVAETAADKALAQAQKGFPSSPILGTAAMAGSPRAMQAQKRARAAADRALLSQERAAKAAQSAADKALAEAQKGYPSSPVLGTATMAGSPRWKVAQQAAERKLDAAAKATGAAADKVLVEAQKGYPSSPILGGVKMPGSPIFKQTPFLERQFGKKGSAAISEGLIGGAFPLLFGQGIGASVLGATGGAVGGFAGGGLGFGLSLIGTALGTAFDALAQAAQDTGKALNYPIEGFEKLKAAGLFASRDQEYYISKLIETGQTSRATAEIQAEMIKKIGVSGVNDLADLGDASSKLSKAWAEFNLQLQAALAGPMAGLLEWVTSVVELSTGGVQKEAQSLDPEAFRKAQEQANRTAQQGKPFFSDQDRAAYEKELNRLSRGIIAKTGVPLVNKAKQDPAQQQADLQAQRQVADQIKSAYREGFQLQQRAIDLELKTADIRRRIENEIFNKQQELLQQQIDNDRKRAQVAIETVDLEYQKRIANEEGRAAEVLAAEAELFKTRAQGEAEIATAKKLLELDISKRQRETQDYVYSLGREADSIRRETLSLEMEVADYRLKIEREIENERLVAAAAEKAGATTTTAEQTKGGAMTRGGRPIWSGAPAGVIEYYTGDPAMRGTPAYDPRGHGGKVHHEHVAFKDVESKDIAIKALRGAGLAIGSQYRPGDPGFHGKNLAIDVPAYPNFGRMGFPDNEQGERMLGALVRKTIAKALGGAAAAAPALTAAAPTATAAQLEQARSQVRRPLITPVPVDAAVGARVALDAEDTRLKKNAIVLDQKLAQLQEEKARQRLYEVARGPIEIKQRQEVVNLAKAELAVIGPMSQNKQEAVLFEAQASEILRNRQATDNEILKITKLQGEERKELERALADGVANTQRQIELDREALKLAQERRFIEEKAGLTQQLAVTGVAEQAGFFGAGASAFTSELSRSGDVGQATDLAERTRAVEAKQAVADIRGELNSLTDSTNIAITAANGVGVAFAQSFQGLIDGSMSAREALGSFFKSVADMFLEMAAQIIAKQITMIILQTILKALGAVSGANSASALGTNPNVAAYSGTGIGDIGIGTFSNANGNAFGANGIMPFAKGGAFTNSIVSSPTLFKFANGGTTQMGEMGEAGPEAIMPLSRGAGGRLGVDASGLREAMGRPPGGASGSPVLNMSFQSTTINGVEYVSREQLESAMAETRRNATRDGAKRGMTMTLDRIQNSSSTRRKVGI